MKTNLNRAFFNFAFGALIGILFGSGIVELLFSRSLYGLFLLIPFPAWEFFAHIGWYDIFLDRVFGPYKELEQARGQKFD